jgi:hypothetical protein
MLFSRLLCTSLAELHIMLLQVAQHSALPTQQSPDPPAPAAHLLLLLRRQHPLLLLLLPCAPVQTAPCQ